MKKHNEIQGYTYDGILHSVEIEDTDYNITNLIAATCGIPF